jgi:hypothetical protein
MADNKITDEEYANMVFDNGDGLVVNLDNVQAMSFEALPKGNYPCVVDEATFGNSKSSGKPMISLKWKVFEGDYKGRILFQHLSFSPGALPGTKANLLQLDSELFVGPFNPQQIVDSGALLGRKHVLKVKVDEGQNGDPSNQVQKILPYTSGGDGGFLNG